MKLQKFETAADASHVHTCAGTSTAEHLALLLATADTAGSKGTSINFLTSLAAALHGTPCRGVLAHHAWGGGPNIPRAAGSIAHPAHWTVGATTEGPAGHGGVAVAHCDKHTTTEMTGMNHVPC